MLRSSKKNRIASSTFILTTPVPPFELRNVCKRFLQDKRNATACREKRVQLELEMQTIRTIQPPEKMFALLQSFHDMPNRGEGMSHVMKINEHVHTNCG